ncbi:MAG TPA: ABC transporter ATP-binding protein [Candidatus Ornithomonoglobus merdipullorum]|uniref:ABC transporter ATP-binding protein n=1 Tax=Candidatus Ornithomonoglobus merdipullorum TaxID=2840895 RepID=A0A9D1SF96_9FIRM|nr:ABC transporter ATP-binding protein [Candidatus Ornithomonoglobus merdipullorum]
MTDTILSVKKICFGYGDAGPVLKNVDLDVHRGERLAVIGSNGAGKSTLFLNLNGVLAPDTGEIFLNGKRIGKKDITELRRNVGIVFQDADSQMIASTVYAEVSFGPMNLRLPKEEVRERTMKAMEYMNITHLKDRPPHYLSGGEKKCVSIADIIAMDPDIIIFDEPTVGLDPVNAQILEDVLDRLHGDGKTIILSTHDADLVYRWADRAVVLNDGKIIADSAPDSIFRNDTIIRAAKLRRPAIQEIYDALLEKALVPENIRPRSVYELKAIIKSVYD